MDRPIFDSAYNRGMSPKQIAILTDSTCDIPLALQVEYGIYVQPHVIIWNGQQYRDRVDISPEEFYRRITQEAELPTTSQATAHDFAQTYQRICDDGADAIVAMLVNSGFSGAIQSARIAAETAPVPVTVYDSRAVTMSLGWQVLAAARAKARGGGAAEILAAAEAVRERVCLMIGLDTLEYVHRGGRIGSAQRLIGTALQIKPILTVNHQKGIVEPCGMTTTRKKNIQAVYHNFFAKIGARKGQGAGLHVCVMHGGAQAEAEALAEQVCVDYQPQELLFNITCPALGIHTGPRALALAGYLEE